MRQIVGGFGAGAALAAAAVVMLDRIPRAGLLVGLLAGATGGALAGIGSAPARLWAVVASVLLGVSVGLAGALGTALLQAHTPPAYLGRMMSLSSLAGFGGIPVSYALTGLVAGLWGPAAALLGGTALVAAAAVAALSSQALRRAELATKRTPDGRDEHAIVSDPSAHAD